MIHSLNPSRCLTLLAAALCLTACSRGGGSGTGNQSSGPKSPTSHTALHINTATGSNDHMIAEVLAVSFEDSAGALTSNLLSAPTAIVLADPAASSQALELIQPPADRSYTAIHLLFDPASLRSISTSGNASQRTMVRPDLRIVIPSPWRTDSSSLLQLVHSAAPQSSGKHWSPTLSIQTPEEVIVENTRGRITSIDRGRHHLELELEGHHGQAYEFEWSESSSLFGDDGMSEDRSTFFGRCDIGTNLSLSGLVLDHHRGLGRSAHRHRSHSKDRLLGSVAAIDVTKQTLVVDVQAFIGPQGTRVASSQQITVDASSAQIYTSHRSLRQSLTFAALKLGGIVEVEGRAVTASQWSASEIEIEDQHSHTGQHETEGRVASVDLGARTITVVPRHNDPLIIGGRRVQQLTVQVPAGMQILRRKPDGLISLSGVTNRDRIWLRGVESSTSTQAAPRVDPSWLRVREQ